MIALLRSTDGNPDSRFQKYVWFLEKKNVPFYSMCWDRNKKFSDNEKFRYFHKSASYGKGIKNIFSLISFNIYLLKELIKIRNKIDVIHAADFDSIIPAVVMHKIFGKKVIYDIYDWYVDSRGIKNSILKKIIYSLEHFCIKNSERVIICEPEREKQIIFEPKKIWILPNIPNFDTIHQKCAPNKLLTISYVGILGSERGIENLVRLAKEKKDIKIRVAGFGPLSYLFDDVQDYQNIVFLGSVPYKEALKIMSSSDIIYACYETSNPNHILAAPNKYYEGLYLGKPIITTSGTIVGDKTKKNNTGYVIGESYESLTNLVESITIEDLLEKGKNAEFLWDNNYKNYIKDFLNHTYLPFIESINSDR